MTGTPFGAADVTIVPATTDRSEDILAAVSPGCWCMLPRFTEREMPEGREAKLLELAAGERPPGLLAYVNGTLAGWIGLGPIDLLPRLRRSTTLTNVDDLPVWSIVCFRVQRRFRGRGLMRLLVQSAVEHARSAGAPAIQAYPADTGSERNNPTSAYVGSVRLFEGEGFERIIATPATAGGFPRVLMRRYLTE